MVRKNPELSDLETRLAAGYALSVERLQEVSNRTAGLSEAVATLADTYLVTPQPFGLAEMFAHWQEQHDTP